MGKHRTPSCAGMHGRRHQTPNTRNARHARLPLRKRKRDESRAQQNTERKTKRKTERKDSTEKRTNTHQSQNPRLPDPRAPDALHTTNPSQNKTRDRVFDSSDTAPATRRLQRPLLTTERVKLLMLMGDEWMGAGTRCRCVAVPGAAKRWVVV